MTLRESYQSAYAAKNKALRQQYKAKNKALKAQKKQISAQGTQSLREAYASFLRGLSTSTQALRAAGKTDGAAQNQAAGAALSHQKAQSQRRAQTAEKISSVNQKMSDNKSALTKKLSDNKTALTQKLDALTIKEQTAAKKAAEKAAKEAQRAAEKKAKEAQKAAEKKAKEAQKASQKSSSSAKATTKSQVLSMLRMGIYDSSFASILGVADSEVRAYIKQYQSKKNKSKNSQSALDPNGKLPGTYKPPLK